jgi:hypothetical protein
VPTPIKIDRKGHAIEEIMNLKGHTSNIVDYKIVTEKSPVDPKMVNAYLKSD